MKPNYVKQGLTVAVILLFLGVAFAPTINAGVNKPDIDGSKLIEYIDKIPKQDCNCNNEEPIRWKFPIFCGFLNLILIVLFVIIIKAPNPLFAQILFVTLQRIGYIIC